MYQNLADPPERGMNTVSNRHLKMCLWVFNLELVFPSLCLMRDLEKEQAAEAMSRHIHVSLYPPAKGISIALFKVVLLYPLVTWHQELSHDFSGWYIRGKCTIRNTHKSSLEAMRLSTSNNRPLRQICLPWSTTTSQCGERNTRRLGWNSGSTTFWNSVSPNSLATYSSGSYLTPLDDKSLICEIGFETIHLIRLLCRLNRTLLAQCPVPGKS